MNRLEELGAKRVELAAEMRKLTELDAMTEVQSKEFDRLQGEVRAVDKQIERINAVEACSCGRRWPGQDSPMPVHASPPEPIRR